MGDGAKKALAESIDKVEGAYEFFLAYAAQGIVDESKSASIGRQLRKHIDAMAEAVGGIASQLSAFGDGPGGSGALEEFRDVVEADAARAGAVIALVRAQPSITSQLIDNLNASVHVRTLLTDLFILDESLRLGVDDSNRAEAPESIG